MQIIIINGPNLNLLGKREPDIYGDKTFDVFFQELAAEYSEIDLSYFQSNVEGELINKLHEVGFDHDGIILNAGGYTHTSVSLADAIASIETPVIETHLSNIFSREDYRHVSLLSKNCIGVICGFGMNTYRLALESLIVKKKT